jgi:UPF0755 protein
MEDTLSQGNPVPRRSRKFKWIILLLILAFGLKQISQFVIAPADFPTGSFLKITQGETLSEIVSDAAAKHLVRSQKILKVLIELSGGDRHIVSGDYYFKDAIPVWTVATRLATGNFAVVPVKLTLIEGTTRAQMAALIAPQFIYFDTAQFLKDTEGKEGFLFPDTYFVSPAADTTEIETLLENNFETRIAPLEKDIAANAMSKHDIVTLASIVEKEASGDNDRSVIAGILLNRLRKGIRLQVDAPFLYISHQDGSNVTAADMQLDSLYNTYTHAGLPPGPIGSPGLSSIEAVLHPTPSDYLFYLHDAQGGVHYAKTFAEHEKNIQTYLRK